MTSQADKARQLASQAARGTTLPRAAVVFTMAAPTLAILFGLGEHATTLLSAGLVAAVLSRVEDLKSLAGWGFSAELREAQRIANEASITAEELRRLAVPLARISLGMAIGGGRWGGQAGVRDRTRELVDQLLNAIEASGEEREVAYTEWKAWERFDLAGRVLNALNHAVAPDRQAELNAAAQLLRDGNAPSCAAASEWRRIAVRFDALSPEVDAAMAALEAAEREGAAISQHSVAGAASSARRLENR